MARGFLRMVSGARAGTTIPLLPDQPLLIGRTRGDLVLEDPLVSGVHCRIVAQDGQFTLQDLGSTNGTTVDGRLVRDAILQPGAEVGVGASRLILFVTEDEEASDSSEGAGLEIAWLLDQELVAEEGGRPRDLIGQGLRLPPGMGAVVEIVAGPDAGSVFRLSRGTAAIGRRQGEVPLSDAEVSRRHAFIEVFGRDMVFVRDVASTNGTYYNGRRVQVARLHEDDTVGCGKSVLRFRSELLPAR